MLPTYLTTRPMGNVMNNKQAWVIRLWLALVAALALFPPFEVSVKVGAVQLPMETNTRHSFVLHRENEIVDIGLGARLTTTAINLPALFCELLALTAVAGIALVSTKDKIQK